MCKGRGRACKARSGDPAPLTWAPGRRGPGADLGRRPHPHRAPAAGRAKSTARAEQEARRPGAAGPEPGAPRRPALLFPRPRPPRPGAPPPAPAAPGPVPAPPNAARSTHARLAAALAREKSYWSSDLISGTRKVLLSGPGPGGAASTMAAPGLREPAPRSLGLGCAALAPGPGPPPPLLPPPSQVRPLALATQRRPRPGAEPRCAPPPAQTPTRSHPPLRLRPAACSGVGRARTAVWEGGCGGVRVRVRACAGEDEGPSVCGCVCWPKCVPLDVNVSVDVGLSSLPRRRRVRGCTCVRWRIVSVQECVLLAVCASLNAFGSERAYLRVSACAYLGGSVTAPVCVSLFHELCVQGSIWCRSLYPENIVVASVRVCLCFVRTCKHLDVLVFCVRM